MSLFFPYIIGKEDLLVHHRMHQRGVSIFYSYKHSIYKLLPETR